MKMTKGKQEAILTNSQIAELLTKESDAARPPLQRALRRAARRALLWPEEVAELVRQNRSLTELSSIGPYLEKQILRWLDHPPALSPPPEIRKGFLSITQARLALAKSPLWPQGIQGDLQMHSEWSDGTASIRDMAKAAEERNYQYIAITDHSKGLKIASGIDEAQLDTQAEEIDEINRSFQDAGKKIRILRSVELNLSPTGGGDMEEGSLEKLDIVLGCFHSALRKKEDQTDRYIAALRNPAIQILGHPRGRIYNFRLGLQADWPRIFDLAAELDKAVEIDCYPGRQDLSPDLVLLAKKAGCRISLGTDAHGPSQLMFMEFGLASALRAGIRRDRILNFMPREELLKWVASVRGAKLRTKAARSS